MPEQLLFDKPAINKAVVGGVVAVVVALLGGMYYWFSHKAAAPVVPPSVQTAPPAAAPEERIEHPVPTAQAPVSKAPLPDLNDSDQAITEALGEAGSGTSLAQYLVPESIIRHIVVTVDNLPRQKVTVDKRPIIPAAGTFMVNGDELHATLDSRNYQRYEPIMNVIRKADVQRFATVYLRFYPLFQKAYQDLGYPSGYFNDRLVKVIDVLLATPQVTGPVDLVRPNVMYQFADSTLESRPAGQKILIRIGNDNATVVKAKLMELRAIITAVPPKH